MGSWFLVIYKFIRVQGFGPKGFVLVYSESQKAGTWVRDGSC